MNIKKLVTPENMSSIENERHANVCPTCEGTGRVVVTKEGEMYSDYCEDCCGEGVIEEDEPSFELPLYKIYERVD
jgi:DnaJ-class molecular chaperone